jgi:cytochrome c553
MKKYFTVAAIIIAVVLLSNCHSAKKASTETAAPTITYEANMQSLVSTTCSPCHFPAKGGNKKPFDSYEALSANIDSMIGRIELNPTDKGFMPFKRPKLSDSTIAVFKQWRDSGTPK